ncbi:MAG: putative transposase [Geminicoccaceae bacterium]|jgi:transposase-like protein|nr:putative transposase [Geminicoccaceae bacterium]
MPRHRRHSISFKRQVVQAYLDGDSLHGLAQRHDVCRNLIRLWIKKYEAGEFDAEIEAANTVHEYEAKIARLERKVGQLTMELDFLKGLSRKHGRRATGPRRSLPAPRPLPQPSVRADEACTLDDLRGITGPVTGGGGDC